MSPVLHMLQLVLEVFPDTFEELNRMCALVKRVFCQSPKRRLELRAFMMQQGLSPLMPVFAVQTRWGSWIKAVQYLAGNIDVLQGFIPTLPPTSKAVRDLGVLLEENGKLLKVEATFIVGAQLRYSCHSNQTGRNLQTHSCQHLQPAGGPQHAV